MTSPMTWKLVPVEPTIEMMTAGAKAWAAWDADDENWSTTNLADKVWLAMLAAAPEPPAHPTDIMGRLAASPSPPAEAGEVEDIEALNAELRRCAWQNNTSVRAAALITRLAAERDAAIADLYRWRGAFQDCTPGGSEFMSPASVKAYMQNLKHETVEAKKDRVRANRERDAALAQRDALAARVRELEKREEDWRKFVDVVDEGLQTESKIRALRKGEG